MTSGRSPVISGWSLYECSSGTLRRCPGHRHPGRRSGEPVGPRSVAPNTAVLARMSAELSEPPGSGYGNAGTELAGTAECGSLPLSARAGYASFAFSHRRVFSVNGSLQKPRKDGAWLGAAQNLETRAKLVSRALTRHDGLQLVRVQPQPSTTGTQVDFHCAVMLRRQWLAAFWAVHPMQFLQPTLLHFCRNLLCCAQLLQPAIQFVLSDWPIFDVTGFHAQVAFAGPLFMAFSGAQLQSPSRRNSLPQTGWVRSRRPADPASTPRPPPAGIRRRQGAGPFP